MKHAIFQLIIIDNVIKVEFKITTGDGFNKLTEKLIETEADYEQFKRELLFGIESLDEIMKQAIRNPSLEAWDSNNKEKQNGQQRNNAGNVRKAEHRPAPVQ